jgi:hypothetical protein
LRFSCIFSALTLHAPAHDPKKRNDYQPQSTEPLHTAQNLPPDSKQGPSFTENSENAFLSRPENGPDRRAESTKSDEKISGIAPFYMKDALRYSGTETKNPPENRESDKAQKIGPHPRYEAIVPARGDVSSRIGKPEYHGEAADRQDNLTQKLYIKRYGSVLRSVP